MSYRSFWLPPGWGRSCQHSSQPTSCSLRRTHTLARLAKVLRLGRCSLLLLFNHWGPLIWEDILHTVTSPLRSSVWERGGWGSSQSTKILQVVEGFASCHGLLWSFGCGGGWLMIMLVQRPMEQGGRVRPVILLTYRSVEWGGGGAIFPPTPRSMEWERCEANNPPTSRSLEQGGGKANDLGQWSYIPLRIFCNYNTYFKLFTFNTGNHKNNNHHLKTFHDHVFTRH